MIADIPLWFILVTYIMMGYMIIQSESKNTRLLGVAFSLLITILIALTLLTS